MIHSNVTKRYDYILTTFFDFWYHPGHSQSDKAGTVQFCRYNTRTYL